MKQAAFMAALTLLIMAFFGASASAKPSEAQEDAAREAVFRTLLPRAAALMPEAKVYILECDTGVRFGWQATRNDPDEWVLSRFAGSLPHVIPVSHSGSGASELEIYHDELETKEHGPVLEIVSLQWTSDIGADVETDIDPGLPRPSESRPYQVTLQDGQWVAREDAAREWRQAMEAGDVCETVVRSMLPQGVYGGKQKNIPYYLSFGSFSPTTQIDPPDSFMERFAKSRLRLQKASQCPYSRSRKVWIMLGVSHVKWITDDEAEVYGGEAANNVLSVVSLTDQVTRNKSRKWQVESSIGISI